MNTLRALVFAAAPLWAGGVAWAQNGNMMGGAWGGGWMGGYGGIWVPILLVAVLAGFAVWVIKRK